MTAISRWSFRCASRNSTGSRPAACASSSMNDSFAHVFWIRAGERSGPARNAWLPRVAAQPLARDHVRRRRSSSCRRCSAGSSASAGATSASGVSGKPSRMPDGRFAGGPGGRRGWRSTPGRPRREVAVGVEAAAHPCRYGCRSSPTCARPRACTARAPACRSACESTAASSADVVGAVEAVAARALDVDDAHVLRGQPERRRDIAPRSG